MTREQAEAEAVKRERHKGRSLNHKRWEAVHTSVKGWHVALVDCPLHAAIDARRRALEAARIGDMGALMEAAGDALLARVRASLSSPSIVHARKEEG